MNRTNKTNLLDEDLILLNVLFDKRAPLRYFEDNEIFEQAFNTDGPKYSIEQFCDRINSLIESNILQLNLSLISRVDKHFDVYVEMTKNGGELWERELEPIWEKYVFAFNTPCEKMISVFSPSIDTAKNYIKELCENSVYDFVNPVRLEVCEIINGYDDGIHDDSYLNWIPWKKFDLLFNIRAPLNFDIFDSPKKSNSDNYLNKLNWWKNLHELEILQGKRNVVTP